MTLGRTYKQGVTVKRLQNRIAESKFALSVTVLYAILICLANGLIAECLWIQMGCLMLSTYLFVELNNTNSLIRVYSRMVSCAYLVLSISATFLFQSIAGSVVSLCVIAFYMLFFQTYQDRKSVGKMFYAFACLGIASTFFVQILYFIPVLWILMKFNIMSMSGRTFMASLLGLIAPYWFIGAYFVYIGETNRLISHALAIIQFYPIYIHEGINHHYILTFAYIGVLAITGIIHFLRHSYLDNIRTRMLYEVFIVMDICGMVFLILQPQQYDILIRIMIINTAPLIAHFIALTRTKVTSISFYIIIAASLAVTTYNLWQHLTRF